jgi:hypothetical protein
MAEETTQLDLTNELDRLSAMRGEDDGEGVRVEVHDAVIDPDGVEGRRLTGTTVEGPSDLRGCEWAHPLDALHRPHVTPLRDGNPVDIATLVDAVGGPDLDRYVLDRERYVVAAVENAADPLTLRVVEAPARTTRSAGDRIEVTAAALSEATVRGYADRPRYRVFDGYGHPTTLD